MLSLIQFSMGFVCGVCLRKSVDAGIEAHKNKTTK